MAKAVLISVLLGSICCAQSLQAQDSMPAPAGASRPAASNVPAPRMPSVAAPRPGSFHATRAVVGNCIFSQGESAIAAALISFGIEKAFNLVGGALSAAGQDKPSTYYATGNFERPINSAVRTCIIIVKGRFSNSATTQTAEQLATSPPEWAARLDLTQALPKLAREHNLVLTEAPEFVMEVGFVSSKDKSAYTLRPYYAVMNKPNERPLLNFSGGKRHIAVLFSLVPPDSAFDAATNPGAEIILGQVSPGQPLTFRFPNAAIPWPQESRWFKIDAEKINGPVTVRAVVTETRSGSALAKFLAQAFEAVKPSLKEEAENALIPSKAKEARLAELTADAALRAAANTANQTVRASLATCVASTATSNSLADRSARLGLSEKVRADQEGANQAAIAASIPKPFPAQELIKHTAKAELVGETGLCAKSLGTMLGDAVGTSGPNNNTNPGGPPTVPGGPPTDPNG
jgi:hypothetical protein